MAIMNDKWIKKQALEKNDSTFEDKLIKNVLSYGLSSYVYDPSFK